MTSCMPCKRSNQLSYRTGYKKEINKQDTKGRAVINIVLDLPLSLLITVIRDSVADQRLQKGDVPAAPSGTATLLRLSPNYQFYPRPDMTPDFRYPRLSWLDGRCVQGPGTYSPRHG